MKNISLGELTAGRNNNLDAVRLLAAVFVILSHTTGNQDISVFHHSIGTLGVFIFFIISGFLITQSFMTNPNPISFLWARFLRIFPALYCVVLITAFVIGPLFTLFPLSTYFCSSETYLYLSNISLYEYQNFLPGVFTINNGSINEPLWTLRYEFSFYLLVLLLGISAILKNRKIVLGIFALSLIMNGFNVGSAVSIHYINVHSLFQLLLYFSAGMTAYLYRDYIPISSKIFFFVAFLVVIGGFEGGYDDSIFIFLLTYMVLYVGFSPRDNFRWLTKTGDYSYGLYIWAFPIQQIVITEFHGNINPIILFCITLPSAYFLSVLSWHLIEKRMLKLKNAEIFHFKTLPKTTFSPVIEPKQ